MNVMKSLDLVRGRNFIMVHPWGDRDLGGQGDFPIDGEKGGGKCRGGFLGEGSSVG